MISDTFRNCRQTLMQAASQFGFRVRHRPKEWKYDEGAANFLFDMETDPSTGLTVGEKVSVTGPLIPPILSDSLKMEQGEPYNHSQKVFVVLGFVEVQTRIGRSRITNTYCALLDFGFLGDDNPKVDLDKSLKVNLYWVGSLDKFNFV